jgi:hypothetical protein
LDRRQSVGAGRGRIDGRRRRNEVLLHVRRA